MTTLSNTLNNLLKRQNNFCCLCLNIIYEQPIHVEDDVAVNINHEERNLSVSEVLTSVLGFEILDYLLTFECICSQCLLSAIHSYTFTISCKTNSELLTNALNGLYDSFENVEQQSSACKTLFVSLDIEDFTSKQFYDTKRPVNSVTTAHRRFLSIVNTQQLEPKFEIEIYSKDAKKETRRKEIRTSEMIYNKDDPIIKCKECMKSFTTKLVLRNHYLRVHLSKKYNSTQCSKKYGSPAYLEAHTSQSHCLVICSHCGKTFNNKHIHFMKYVCPDCDRVYNNKNNIDRNLECGGSGISTPRSIHVASTSRGVITPDATHLSTPRIATKRLQDLVKSEHIEEPTPRKSKRSINITSSSSTSRARPVMSDEIMQVLQCASDESSDDDEDEVKLEPAFVPRGTRMFAEQDEVPLVDATLNLEWPPQLTTSDRPGLHTSDSIAAPEEQAASQLQPTSKFNFQWRAFTHSQIPPGLRREPFTQINWGPTIPLASPYEAFTAIWDRKIMEHIVSETNIYAQQLASDMLLAGTIHPNSRITKWQDTNVDELYVYFAIILATGIVTKIRIEEYWQKTQDVFSTPGFSAVMSFDRFLLLTKCLHFQNNRDCEQVLTRSQAKLFKVQPIVDHLNDRFSSLYNLSQNITLDESLTMWKGWLNINQYIRNKAASARIKTYEVCESQTGYLWRFEVHAGHNDAAADPQDPVSGIVPDLVLRLLKGLEHKGHTVWMDNFYNSPALARELKVRGFDCVGTLRVNRQFVPTELANLSKTDMVVGQVSGCTSGDVDLVVWRDKNRVALISTYHGLATVRCGDTLKPSIVTDYNICMGGVDRKDQMIAMYPIERKRTKIWYKKFFKRLLNASTLNAYIMYKHEHQTSHQAFRKDLVRELLAKHTPPQPQGVVDRPTVHFPEQYAFLAGKKHERQRRFCTFCKKRTTTSCKTCNVPLCAFTCFQPYHTPVKKEREKENNLFGTVIGQEI